MENIRINVETWGGHTSPEQLADAIESFISLLSLHTHSVTCTIDGIDKTTASSASAILINDKKFDFNEVLVTRYGALTIKLHP